MTTEVSDEIELGSRPLVLAIDDEPGIRRLLRLELTEARFDVVTAGSGHEAIELAADSRPDLVILDLGLPDMSGLEVMRALRHRGDVPVIVLTARSGDRDKVNGLERGADDYLVKPFNGQELVARCRVVLRRAALPTTSPSEVIRVGDLEIDLGRGHVTRRGEPVRLSRTEWLLLEFLAEHAGKVLSSTQILRRVWGPAYEQDARLVRTIVSRLRRKLDPDRSGADPIQTLSGVGYRLNGASREASAS